MSFSRATIDPMWRAQGLRTRNSVPCISARSHTPSSRRKAGRI